VVRKAVIILQVVNTLKRKENKEKEKGKEQKEISQSKEDIIVNRYETQDAKVSASTSSYPSDPGCRAHVKNLRIFILE
jgi:hypothetical protein